jgi:hypothetical protein
MTKQQKLNTLEAVEARAFVELENADPKQVEFNNILNNVGLLRQITELVKFGDPELFTAPESDPTCAPIDPTPIKPVDADVPPQPKPVVETETAPWEDKPEEPQLTFAEVRSKMILFQRAGVDPAPLIQQMGCTRLSEVPKDKYGELLALAEKAAEDVA